MSNGRGPRRREFLAGAASFVPLIYLAGCSTLPSGPAGLFSLGVGSGEPRPDGVVIWTRLAPDPLKGGGMPAEPVEVAWTVAEDERFTRIARRGTATALPEDAHTLHVEIGGLRPGRRYWYRFIANGEASATGRTKTAPARGSAPDRVRFAFASCQQYEQGYYVAHRHLAAEDLDFVLFLGDYIYEISWGRIKVRRHGAGEPVTLPEYRNRYALYRTDADLQAAHAAFPWVVTWDDHEVSNDYANDRGEHVIGPEFLARRAAAYKAFWEHMPLPMSMRPDGAGMQLYRSFDYGTQARFCILDDRQYRDYQPCTRRGWIGGAGLVADRLCPERLANDRSLLGRAQEAWLADSLAGSRARWNVLAQQTLMAPWSAGRADMPLFSTDGWSGYPAARNRLLALLHERKVSNPVVVGGDVHATVVADLKADFDDPGSPTVATEICGTSITSDGPGNLFRTEHERLRNPHVRYAEGGVRGYISVSLESGQATASLRGVEDVRWKNSKISTIARFIVESGRPGARIA